MDPINDEDEIVDAPEADQDQDESSIDETVAEEVKPQNDEDESLIEVPGVGKVKLDDLIKGNMMHSDYTRKTMQLAERRRELDRREEMLKQLEARNPEARKPAAEADPDLEAYDKDEVIRVQKLLRANGFLTKEDLQREREEAQKANHENALRSVWDSFEKTHQEFSRAKDPTGIRAGMLREELSMYVINDPKTLPRVLEKANAEVDRRLSELAMVNRKAVASKNVRSASIGSAAGGGASKPPESDDENLTEEQRRILEDVMS